jgi:hypothetical protein
MSNIKYQEIIEGNLKAEKCTSDFGGPNMWNLCVRTNHGPRTWWESVQWMDVNKIQLFFETKLPRYKEVSKQLKYELQ